MILKSRGSGKFKKSDFKKIGKRVTIEPNVLVFHPENIKIGNQVYVGHNTILHGYYKNEFTIGNNVFISAGCNIYGSCGLIIGSDVGIGPGVTILGTSHDLRVDALEPVNHLPLLHEPIVIEEGSDIGAGAVILGGVTIGKGTMVGAGSVVTRNTKPYSIVVGVPARLLKNREEELNKKYQSEWSESE